MGAAFAIFLLALLLGGVALFIGLAVWLQSGSHRPTSASQAQDGETLGFLEMESGPFAGQRITVSGPRFSIGRTSGNNLALPAQLVSREHALIVLQNGQPVFYDLESTNGSYIKGRRVSHQVLRHGDRISIGPAVMTFVAPGAGTKARQDSKPSESGQTGAVPIHTSGLRTAIPSLSEYRLEFHREGGAAKIYRAIPNGPGPILAVKLLTRTDPYTRQKFADESRLLPTLNHPNITKALETGQAGPNYYIVMEFCPGGSLRERLARPMSNETIARVVAQACAGLHFAHRQGVVHRDIKPENILFDGQDNVKVADFGIAKFSGSLTQTMHGMIVGTPAYYSYEQARGIHPDPRSDVYSLGVVLYEMLTGHPPFEGAHLEILEKHLKEQPRHPLQANPNCDPVLAAVAMKALEKDREERYRSAKEMAEAVGSGLANTNMNGGVRRSIARLRVPAEPRMRIEHGPNRGKVLPLHGAEVVLGRESINPEDRAMSRQHARLQRQGEVWLLEDLGSAYGTYLNNDRVVAPVVIQPGKRWSIRLANTIVTVL